jgi:hypothetical protein
MKLESIVNFFFNILGSELFWIFIIALMGLGRWLLLKETLLFAGKKEAGLTPTEMKKQKKMIFFGRGLIGVGLIFFFILLLILIIPIK